ncbi:hypothetical protein ABEB36_003746 [Hypothenemus hampei]|uniref:KANSL3 helical domain-containing protein n=1 Tax=Hypothenemus hampei TaxID=57062 RepID=A0ABD1F1K5_HYPHA
MIMENELTKYSFPVQMTNIYEREEWVISTDHCYATPWNWKPESSFFKPTRTIFMSRTDGVKPLFSLARSSQQSDDIDVESDVDTPTPVYDLNKASNLMEECERFAAGVRSDLDDENWEDKINKANWTTSQHKLFLGFVKILNELHLGKMVYSGSQNEPVLRRTIIDKSVQRARRLFNTVSYDRKLIYWLHQLLLDNLNQKNLASYLDILQTLKAKLPKFVDKLINNTGSVTRSGHLNNENLNSILKKPWDPLEASLNQDKPKKLPSNPIIVLMPCSPVLSKRNQKWFSLLSNLGQVMSVPTNFGSASHRMTMTNCIDQMFSFARGRIQEVRENFPGRNIILAGIGVGATLALQVAHVENVFCVIALGFSMLTADGKRGEPDDSLLELQCPVLFIIGQCSSTTFQEDLDDLRERMRIETGLIVVGSADNNLIISKKKRREEGITQSIADRCIIDEIGEFISKLILSPFPPQLRQSPTAILADVSKKSRLERKRYNSTASSLDSEPPSPTLRLTRPVGRPAGKTKCKLEAKWAVQVAQARMQAYNLGRNVQPDGQLSTLLQSGIKTIPPIQQKTSGSPTIKVLENVQLTSQATAKLISNSSGRSIDLSKIALGQRATGNVMLLPDGKIKTLPSIKPITVKTSTGTPIVLSMSKGQPRKTKFITKRLDGTPIKKQTFMSFPQPIKTNLPPPTNLTSQDIMDLPIIFADDNQIIDPNMPTDLSTTKNVALQQSPKFLSPTSKNKFVIVNKPTATSGLNNFVVTSPNLKRSSPFPITKQPTKYTKIILSKKAMEPLMKLANDSDHGSTLEAVDLENELIATAVPKPGFSDEMIPLTITSKRGNMDLEQAFTDDDDPDYVPPKNFKLFKKN